MKTRQHLFNNAARGVIRQGGPSIRRDYDGDPRCAYRGNGGRRCGIGHSIPNSRYNTSLEGGAATREDVLAVLEGTSDEEEFLDGLQGCHDSGTPDSGAFLPDFIDHMRDFAEEYDLHTKVLDSEARAAGLRETT